MDIQNLSGKSILFDLGNVTAEGLVVQKGQSVKTFPMEILSAYEYDKKVKRKQHWNNFWVALDEGIAASNASYSSSSTTYSGSSYSSVYGHASGYAGNTYGYANAYGSAYTTTYSYPTFHTAKIQKKELATCLAKTEHTHPLRAVQSTHL